MLKKMGFGLLLAGSLLSANAFAEINELAPNLSVDYKLKPNVPQVFSNSFYWTINANCKIHSTDSKDELFAEELQKNGKVNGVKLSKGDTMSIVVHPNETLKISAESGAKVRITNRGKNEITAACKS